MAERTGSAALERDQGRGHPDHTKRGRDARAPGGRQPREAAGRRFGGYTTNGTSTSDTMDSSLTRMFIAGPVVSLNGSPTVSPITAAA